MLYVMGSCSVHNSYHDAGFLLSHLQFYFVILLCNITSVICFTCFLSAIYIINITLLACFFVLLLSIVLGREICIIRRGGG